MTVIAVKKTEKKEIIKECPLCSRTNLTKILREGYHLFLCLRCGAVWKNKKQ